MNLNAVNLKAVKWLPEPQATVLCIDSVTGPWGGSQAVYHFSSVPLEEILEENPQAWGGYLRRRDGQMMLARFGIPGVFGVGSAALFYLSLLSKMPPNAAIGLAILSVIIGIAMAGLVGVPLAMAVSKVWLQPAWWFVFGRVPVDVADGLSVGRRDEGDAFVLKPAVAPPLSSFVGEDDEEAIENSLVGETELAIYTIEQLSRGEDAFATKVFLEALRASRGGQQPPQKSGSPVLSMDRSPNVSRSP